MRKIRGYVLRNREFLASITGIFRATLTAYAQKLATLVKLGKMKEGGNVTFLAHNGKTVATLISANTGFFGEVVKETFKKFIADVRKENLEVTIIGKMGRALFVSEEPKRPYVYFDLPDFGVDAQKLTEVIKHLVQYEEIRVYFGKFESLITQKPEVQSISSGTPAVGKPSKSDVYYLFEPSIEEILMFFETQIFASLFDQSLRESQLAKFASRILAMDRATQNIEKKVDTLNLSKLTISHKLANIKQLNSLGPVVFGR
jgi:F-type H+-transporting ATPase subunit gamma